MGLDRVVPPLDWVYRLRHRTREHPPAFHPLVFDRSPDGVSIRQFVTTLRNPAVLLVSTASLGTYTIWTFLVTWIPTYGTDILGLDLATAGAATTLVSLAGIIARPSGGCISDRLDGRLRPVIVTFFLLSIPFHYGLSSASLPLWFALYLAVTGAAVNLAVGLYLVYVNRLAASAIRDTSLSVLLTFSQIGNLAAPVLGGWVIAQLSWMAGFGLAGGLAIIGFVIIALVSTTTNGLA